MKKPEIKIDSNHQTKFWGYSFKECVDYIKLSYDIPDVVYCDLINWGDPLLLDYPIFFVEKSKDTHKTIANDMIKSLYLTEEVNHKQEFIYSIKILFKEFSIEHTIENIPILAFLTY